MEFRENRVASAIAAIGQSPPINGWMFDPPALIRAANALVALGRDEGCAAIAAYVQRRETAGTSDPPDSDSRALLLLRAVFDPASPETPLPAIALGRPDVDLPEPDRTWPRLPLVLVEDVPFLLVGGYRSGGTPRGVRATLSEHLALACWRTKLLRPRVAVAAALEILVTSRPWLDRIKPAQKVRLLSMLRDQAERSLAKFERDT
jgi:hypothetical protein